HPRFTGYRIIIHFLTAVFGIWKAALTYGGQNIATNMTDWAFGVTCVIVLFWLGLYQSRHSAICPWFFEKGYFSKLVKV
ncbi:hypothetical protein BD410DRAFT_682273, partial [Rickenella mellea]